jgi:hypothetical protein
MGSHLKALHSLESAVPQVDSSVYTGLHVNPMSPLWGNLSSSTALYVGSPDAPGALSLVPNVLLGQWPGKQIAPVS